MTIKSSKTLVEEAMKQIKTLKLDEVSQLIDKKSCTLIDVRDIREIQAEGGINEALHIPRGMLEFWLDPDSPYYKKIDQKYGKKTFVLFCGLGLRSALSVKTLQDMGFTDVAHVEGGYRKMAASGIFQLIKLKKN